MHITISTTNGSIIYTFTVLVGYLLAVCITLFTCRKFGYSRIDLLLLALVVAPFGLVGARLFSFIFRLPEAIGNSQMLITLLLSGFMYYGGLIGGAIGVIIYCKVKNTSTLATLDMCALVLPVAHAIGRIGCLYNGCCYGRPTDGLGVIYTNGVWDGTNIIMQGVPLVPVQLYESIFNCILFAILVILFIRTNTRGLIVSTYLIFYSLWRTIIEFFRIDSRGTLLMLSTSQFISVCIALPCGILILLSALNVFKSKSS